MKRHRFANADLTVSIIGLGCYGMSGAYGPADDAESIATIHRALDLGVNLLDTSASYGQGHNHRLIGEAIRGRRHEVVIHSKSGSPRDGSPDAVRGGGDPRYLRQTCEQSLKNLGIETLDVFCMSRVDPSVLLSGETAMPFGNCIVYRTTPPRNRRPLWAAPVPRWSAGLALVPALGGRCQSIRSPMPGSEARAHRVCVIGRYVAERRERRAQEAWTAFGASGYRLTDLSAARR
jgi:Aldo/keto reductase family